MSQFIDDSRCKFCLNQLGESEGSEITQEILKNFKEITGVEVSFQSLFLL
jgi:hypothetical protein